MNPDTVGLWCCVAMAVAIAVAACLKAYDDLHAAIRRRTREIAEFDADMREARGDGGSLR